MSLVQYSDSDSDADLSASPPPKKSRPNPPPPRAPSLPPLPAAFHDLYASSTRVSIKDDPSLHGGRKRVIPHVEGNWPTHLYLECALPLPPPCLPCFTANFGTGYPARDELSLLADLIVQCQGEDRRHGSDMHSLLYSDLGAQLPLHISLSRPVVLRTEQRSSFAEILRQAVRDSHISPWAYLSQLTYET